MFATVTTLAFVTVPLQAYGEVIHWAILFFALAILAYFAGVRGVAGMSARIAKWLVIIFIVLAILSLLM